MIYSPTATATVFCDYREHYITPEEVVNHDEQYDSRGTIGPRCEPCCDAYIDAYIG